VTDEEEEATEDDHNEEDYSDTDNITAIFKTSGKIIGKLPN